MFDSYRTTFKYIYKVFVIIGSLFFVYYLGWILAVYSVKVSDLVRLTPEQTIQNEFQNGSLVGYYGLGFYPVFLSPENLNLKNAIPVFGISDTVPDSMWVPVECPFDKNCPQYYFLDLLPQEQRSCAIVYSDDFNVNLLKELSAAEGDYKIYEVDCIYFSVSSSSSAPVSVKAFGLTKIKPGGQIFSQASYSEFQNVIKGYRTYFYTDRHSFSRREKMLRRKIHLLFE